MPVLLDTNIVVRWVDPSDPRYEAIRAAINRLKVLFLPDSDLVYTEWRKIVVEHSVSGVQVRDARLVAAMRVHGIGRLLTLNARDFRRYGIDVLEPKDVLAGE